MRDFVAAWNKVMNLDRYDLLARGKQGSTRGISQRLSSLPVPLAQAQAPLSRVACAYLRGRIAQSPATHARRRQGV